VRPSDSPAYLIHPEDVVAMRDAGTGLTVYAPLRKGPNRISTANAVLIGVLATLGGLFLLAHALPQG
jgi:hypothetical protein